MEAFDRLPAPLAALNAEDVDYVLFGGQAVDLHGILRFTDASTSSSRPRRRTSRAAPATENIAPRTAPHLG
ncbi:MAG: hypothetical protein ABI629_06370 [bacterium]